MSLTNTPLASEEMTLRKTTASIRGMKVGIGGRKREVSEYKHSNRYRGEKEGRGGRGVKVTKIMRRVLFVLRWRVC